MKSRGLIQNPGFVRALIFISVITGIFLASNFLILGGDAFFNLSNTLISPAAALSASFLFYQVWRNKKFTNARALWSGMALGFGLWGLADVIWAFYSVVLGVTVPYPSIADLLWVIGYIPLYFALITRLRTLKTVPTRRQQLLIILLNIPWIVLTAVYILPPIVQDFDLSRLVEGVVNILYPLADVGLVIIACMILILLKEGRFAIIWRLIFSGIFIMTVSDLLFSYSTWQGLYYPDDRVNALTIFIDTTYTLAYICAGFGIYVYQLIWNLDEKFDISIETMPSPRYYAFVGTNQEHQIITVGDNFFCLVNGGLSTNYAKQRLDKVLGVGSISFQALIEKIKSHEMICNEPFTIVTTDRQDRKVWITAIAVFNPGREFAGANFALSADIEVGDNLRLPAGKEIQEMLNYLLTSAGSRPEDEIQTMRVYFLEIIRLLSSILYQFGGANIRAALFDEINHKIQQMHLPVKINSQVISLPELQEGKDLASLLLPMLHAARVYTTEIIGEHIVNDGIEELEKQLSETAQRDLDKYKLLAFHAAQ